MIKQNCEFDFTRNDKFYELTIPAYSHIGDSVYYEVHLKDLVQNQIFIHSFRFKELKEYHEQLLELKVNSPICSWSCLNSPRLTSGKKPIKVPRWSRRGKKYYNNTLALWWMIRSLEGTRTSKSSSASANWGTKGYDRFPKGNAHQQQQWAEWDRIKKVTKWWRLQGWKHSNPEKCLFLIIKYCNCRKFDTNCDEAQRSWLSASISLIFDRWCGSGFSIFFSRATNGWRSLNTG